MVAKYSNELLKPKEKALRRAAVLGCLVGLGQFSIMGVNALGVFSAFNTYIFI